MTIYLDNLAATPVDPRVARRHCEAMAAYPGNAHSAEHSAGVEAQEAIEEAAATILAELQFNEQSDGGHLLFTPGASAALWLAVEDLIGRVSGRPARVAASAAEHPALLTALGRAARQNRIELTWIAVDGSGGPCIASLDQALREGPDLVCTMAANNEVGTLTDLATINTLISAAGARHLVDASQAAGKISMDAAGRADLIVVSGAKVYGPRRTGALIGQLSKQAQDLAHDTFGSPDASSAVALSCAIQFCEREREVAEPRVQRMRDLLQARLEERVSGLRVNGAPGSRGRDLFDRRGRVAKGNRCARARR